MNLNFHAIVRGAITALNEDTPGTVYVSTGRTNVRGILTPTFTPVAAMLQMQAQKHDPLRHEEGVQRDASYLTVYAYGNFSDLDRPSNNGGSVVYVPGPSNRAGWYLVTQVLEWWGENQPSWCALEVTQQLNAATIADYVKNIANGANPV